MRWAVEEVWELEGHLAAGFYTISSETDNLTGHSK